MRVKVLPAGAAAVLVVIGLATAARAAADPNIPRCQSDDPKVAIPACTALMDSGHYPGFLGDLLLTRGDAYQRNKQYLEAAKDFDAYITAFPNESVGYERKGTIFYVTGKAQTAIGFYTKALELDSRNTGALYFRGEAKKTLGDEAGGAADIARAIEIDPSLRQ